MSESFFVTTNGCAINKYKVDAYSSIIKNAGLPVVDNEDNASVILFLLCSFTAEREEDSISKIHHLQDQGKKVIIAGCTLPGIIGKLNNVDVIENEITPFNNFRAYLSKNFGKESVGCFIPSELEGDATIIQIATGCTGNCKYCSIKSAQLNNGKIQSVQPDIIIDQISRVENKSIYLAGHEVSSYGLDIGYTLPKLLKKIWDNFPGIDIQLGNLSVLTSSNRNKDDFDILSKVTGNINFPIQSGSDKVIKEMGRNYTVDQFDKLYKELTSRGCSVMTDYIIGYPTETDDDFNETLNFVKKYPMQFSQIFAYEPRENTPAASLELLPKDVIEDRVCDAIATYLKTGLDFYGKEVYYNTNVQFI